MFAPKSKPSANPDYEQRLAKILKNQSEYFSLANSTFGNEKYKKNCARLAILRDFDLQDSYTIESSCFGYEESKKGFQEESEIIQFLPKHFLKFG